MNDYGTVDFFAIPTLTVGLIDIWLGMNSLSSAAQIASLMLSIVLVLLLIEQISRANQKLYQQGSSRFSKLPIVKLQGFKSFCAFSFCAIPVVIGFMIPIAILIRLSVLYFAKTWTDDFLCANWQQHFIILYSSVSCNRDITFFSVTEKD